jgi:hypothetical protein
MTSEIHTKQVSQLLKLQLDAKKATTDSDKFLLRRQIAILKERISRDTPVLTIPQI